MSIQSISKNELLDRLEESNPWWKGVSYNFPLKKKRDYFKSFQNLVLNKKVQRAVVLMGPRRVGKTVLLKQFVHYVLKNKKFLPSYILFVSVDDPIFNDISLEKLIELFQEKNKLNKKKKKLIIFDEIQYLKDWERHLKVLVDKYPNIKFIVSGSAAATLKRKSSESGAGRFTDFFLPPLTFKEFINLSPKGKPTSIKKWNQEFLNYINFGGYPEPIFNKDIQKDVQRFIREDVIDKVLLKDLPSLYGISDTQELNRFFVTLAFNSGNEISLDGLCTKLGMVKNTIIKYLEYLESSFLIKRVYKVDDSFRRFKRVRTFKAYLTNPSMYASLFRPIKEEGNDIDHIIETAVFSQHFHTEESLKGQIFYAKWKRSNKDYEVDLVRTDGVYKPMSFLEIKWSDRHLTNTQEELKGLLDLAIKHKQQTVFTTSKTKLDEKKIIYENHNLNIIYLPCSNFCYNISEMFLEEGGINMKLFSKIKK